MNERLPFQVNIIRPERAFKMEGKCEKRRIFGINFRHLCTGRRDLVFVQFTGYNGNRFQQEFDSIVIGGT